MTFQKTVRFDQAAGVVGEIAYDGPSRVTPGLIKESSFPNAYVGRFFTLDPETGLYGAGGDIGGAQDTFIMGGISVMPKEYVSFGNDTDGPLGPSMKLPNGHVVSFMEMGYVWLYSSSTVKQGMRVVYNTNTGVISVFDRVGELPANTGEVPNTVVHRVPFATATDGGMYVAKMTN